MQTQQIQTFKLSTTVGCGALLVWSLYAFVVSELLVNLPVFETLFLMFATSFVAMSIRLSMKKQWHLLVKQPRAVWMVGIIGVCGSDIAYITAVKYAPPAHVDFIDYLWPFLVIIFSSLLPKEKMSIQHIVAGGLGFLGVFLLLTGGNGLVGFKGDYLHGYLFALTAAIVWSTYTIVSRYYEDIPTEMVGMYCGFGAVFSLLMHFQFETWVCPTLFEGTMVFLLGLSSGMAYLLWTYATQKGNIKLLGVLAYFTPILSMGLLVLTGKEPMSIALVFACILVITGVIIGSVDWSRIRSALSTNS